MTSTDSDFDELFKDEGDEDSFNGFNIGPDDLREASDDSDVNLDGLVSDEDEEAVDERAPETDDKEDEEEMPWTDQFCRFVPPNFNSAICITFPLPENPKEIDFFSAFIDDDLWDLIVLETNRYAQQKLADSPAHLANFLPVMRAELKAFIAVSIIMGTLKLPSIALYWTSNEVFGNQGIKKLTKIGFKK